MPGPEHDALIAAAEAVPSPTWSDRALLACLRELRDGGPTEWRSITVRDGWPLRDTEGFCVVYSWSEGDPIGLRAALEGSRGAPVYADGVYAEPFSGDEPTAEQFGWEIADFAVAEPLGRRADHLVRDGDGVGWWGVAPLPV